MICALPLLHMHGGVALVCCGHKAQRCAMEVQVRLGQLCTHVVGPHGEPPELARDEAAHTISL